jgi:protease-4
MRNLFIGFVIGIAAAFSILLLSSLTGFSFEKIAVISIKGEISPYSSILSEATTTSEISELIQKAEDDPSIKAVVFEIDSPGGSVVASREMALAVKRMEKPTVCWLGDLAASGAYWVASSCDRIVADPLTLTGSIGVTASYLEFSKLFEKYGVGYERIVSGENKDIGTPFRNLTEEERTKMQYLVEETFNYFIKSVAENRNLTQDQIEKISKGDIFLGKDAIELGLVDELGTFEDAKDLAADMTGSIEPEFVPFKKQGVSIFDLI